MRLMWWHQKEKRLREQLTEAIAKVRQQIDVQSSSTNVKAAGIDHRREIAVAELEAELAQLEEALANMGPDDA